MLWGSGGAEVQQLLFGCELGWVSKQAVHQCCVVPQRSWSCLWIAPWPRSRKHSCWLTGTAVCMLQVSKLGPVTLV